MKPKLKFLNETMPGRQIVCFIDPQRFSALLGTAKAVKLRIYQNRSYLNNGKLLVYVDDKGVCRINCYDIAEASNAHIILVPDIFSFAYDPQCEFTVLFHGLTPTEQIDRLSQLPHYRGSKKAIEERSTVYHEIAEYLNKDGETSDDHERSTVNRDAFDSIWQKLANEFLKSQVDNFFTKILMGNELDSIDLPDCLKEFAEEFDEFKKIVGKSYESNNAEHKEAFIKLKSRFL